MMGLLLKDIMVLKKQMRFILVFLVVYGALAISENNTSMFMYMAIMFGIFLPTTSIGYDDRAEWNKYAACMPVKRSYLVISKYILGFAGLAFGILCSIIMDLSINQSFTKGTIETLIGISCAGIFIIGLYVPITFRFGIERSRYVILGIVFLPVILLLIFFKDRELPKLENIPDSLIFGIIATVVLLFTIISILISVRIIKNKQY